MKNNIKNIKEYRCNQKQDNNRYPKIKINKDEVLFFYEQNREMFLRKQDEAFVHHYQTTQLNDARFIRKMLLKKGRKGMEEIEAFRVESKTIKKGRVLKDFNRAIFESKKNIVDPVEIIKNYGKN